ncbi:MAG: TolB family protein [Anaerolineales bacterium]
MRGKWHYLLLTLLLCSLSGLAGCAGVDQLTDTLYPTPTLEPRSPQPSPTTTSTPTATSQESTTSPTPAETPSPATSPSPEPESDDQENFLVFAHDGKIYRGDYFGQQPTEIADVSRLEAWDFTRGLLATADRGNLHIIDLNRGELHGVELQGEIIYSHVLWGTSGQRLLHAAMVEDETAPTLGRSVDLRAVGHDGEILSEMRLEDLSGVTLLRYDDRAGKVLLIPQGGDPAFTKAEYYDVESGERQRTLPIQGEGEIFASPDGRYLLTERLDPEQGAELSLYDLSTETEEIDARTWQHPADSHSVSHTWSPDGEYVAYLLQDGASFADSTEGLGLWVLEIASMEAEKVMEEASLSSTVVDWTPDGEYIVGYHRGTEGESHFYMIRPDGGDRRLLTLPSQGEILGWMTSPDEAPAERVSIDRWRGRFEDVAGEATAMAQVVAEFVAANAGDNDETVSRDLYAHLEETGWSTEEVEPRVERLADQLFLAQLPPFSIYLLDSGEAHLVAHGHLVIDAHLEDDELGVIFGMREGESVQPTYMLLHREEDGFWTPLWTPQGHRDWVATDGEVRFMGEGLDRLRVRGSSFGLDEAEDQVFAECRECPHRWLTATWHRSDGAYERESNLPSDASLSQIFWEMTERTPYALLHECLRRLQEGQAVDKLVGTSEVADQIRTLGLLDKEAGLVPERETEDSVYLSDAEKGQAFRALIQDGKLIRVERIEE